MWAGKQNLPVYKEKKKQRKVANINSSFICVAQLGVFKEAMSPRLQSLYFLIDKILNENNVEVKYK